MNLIMYSIMTLGYDRDRVKLGFHGLLGVSAEEVCNKQDYLNSRTSGTLSLHELVFFRQPQCRYQISAVSITEKQKTFFTPFCS